VLAVALLDPDPVVVDRASALVDRLRRPDPRTAGDDFARTREVEEDDR
jgi:hypothetical protein